MIMISEFPLFLFTSLGGMAAGTYVVRAFFPQSDNANKRPWLFPLVCLVLLGVGLLGVLGHLGRPERFMLALVNPTSMICQEAYWSIALGVLMLVDLVVLARKGASPLAVRILAAIAAAGLMCVMANAYFTSWGNPVWTSWQTLALFVVGDLAMGAVLFALIKREMYDNAAFTFVVAILSLLAAISIALVAVQFAAFGQGVAMLVVGVIFVVVGALCALLAWKRKLTPQAASLSIGALVLIGVILARYAFYAASIL